MVLTSFIMHCPEIVSHIIDSSVPQCSFNQSPNLCLKSNSLHIDSLPAELEIKWTNLRHTVTHKLCQEFEIWRKPQKHLCRLNCMHLVFPVIYVIETKTLWLEESVSQSMQITITVVIGIGIEIVMNNDSFNNFCPHEILIVNIFV